MKYWDYIHVEELLSLQRGMQESEDGIGNDEVLFIVVHQVYELWFKLVLRELVSVRERLRQNPVPDESMAEITRSLRRCITIYDCATKHFEVVETINTRDYLAFRDQLIGASGFQSAQMREIEILLGLEDRHRIPYMEDEDYRDALREPDGGKSPALHRVEAREATGPSLLHAMNAWLARTPIDGSSDEAAVEAYLEAYIDSHEQHAQSLLTLARERAARPKDIELLEARYEKEREATRTFLRALDRPETERPHARHVRAALVFIESHRELPRLSWPREVLDAALTLEQRMVVWRQRHARMVERTIGRRVGTGGSGGVDYLDHTALKYRVFNDLWEVKTILLRQTAVPTLAHADDYRLRIQD